jgi:serine/threonine-protein kinase HipA
MEVIRVRYQGADAGALSFDTTSGLGSFEYDPVFLARGVELSPLYMPLRPGVYQFPGLEPGAFKGLPGMLADSLPDDFGNAVLDAWVARQGKSPVDITPLQRLQYIGTRGMGALEYAPSTRQRQLNAQQDIALRELVNIAQEILDERGRFEAALSDGGAEDRDAMRALLSVGTSAGGARPKAVLAFDANFSRVRSGQTTIPEGFNHYLLKFDGVTEHRTGQETFGDPLGYGVMEYVYYKMATACHIDMMPCHLLQEGKRRHFLTRRFDRQGNRKIHVQTLNGLAHASYKLVGQYSYEEIFATLRRLQLDAASAEQLFRRMAFNVIARNHDDHTKNFSFLLDQGKPWALAPAYDIAYSYKPGSRWINSHACSINGKRDQFVRADFYALERLSPKFSRRWIDRIIEEIKSAVAEWPRLAREEDVPAALIALVQKNLRLDL